MKNILILILVILLTIIGLAGCTSNDPHSEPSEHGSEEITNNRHESEGNNNNHGSANNNNSHGGQSTKGEHSNNMSNLNFKSSKNEFTELLVSNGTMEEVFPLLCPEREHDWIPSWQANIIWSESGLAEEGAVFKTGPETWIITDYVPNEKVYFVRYNLDVVTRLKINAKEENGKIVTTWTQSQTGTSEDGNAMVEKATSEDFSNMVKSLEVMMNYYMETGNIIDAETLSERLSKPNH